MKLADTDELSYLREPKSCTFVPLFLIDVMSEEDGVSVLLIATILNQRESFDNVVFFYIEAMRTHLIVRKLFSKRSEHIR
jgi:hypothetical protein